MVSFQEVTNTIMSRGYSARQIAEKVGCSRSCIAMLASGKNAEPKYSVGAAIVEMERRTRARIRKPL